MKQYKREPDWSLTIKRAENGYVLEHDNLLSDDIIRRELIAVEEPSDGNEAVTAQRLLWEVLEHFGIYKGIRIELLDEDNNVIDPAPLEHK